MFHNAIHKISRRDQNTAIDKFSTGAFVTTIFFSSTAAARSFTLFVYDGKYIPGTVQPHENVR